MNVVREESAGFTGVVKDAKLPALETEVLGYTMQAAAVRFHW